MKIAWKNISNKVLSDEITLRNSKSLLMNVGLAAILSYYLFLVLFVLFSTEYLSYTIHRIFLHFFIFFNFAACLTLLILGLSTRYILSHNESKIAFCGLGIGLSLGPVFCINWLIGSTSFIRLYIILFFIAGCFYAIGLILWGRILSNSELPVTKTSVFHATLIMLVLTGLFLSVSVLLKIVLLITVGLISSLIGSYLSGNAVNIQDSHSQIVLSDTRKSIPFLACVAITTIWIIYGVSIVLYSGNIGFGNTSVPLRIPYLCLCLCILVLIIVLFKLNKLEPIYVTWLAAPLLATGIFFMFSDNNEPYALGALAVYISMVLCFIQLFNHFAILGNRKDLVSDQIFSWGFLSPFLGGFLGSFLALSLLSSGIDSFTVIPSIMCGALVAAVIASMITIGRVLFSRQSCASCAVPMLEQECPYLSEDLQINNEKRSIHEVFSDFGLTTREEEVANLLLQGRTQSVIAQQLFISPSTVSTHVTHIYQKVNVNFKQELIDLYESLGGTQA